MNTSACAIVTTSPMSESPRGFVGGRRLALQRELRRLLQQESECRCHRRSRCRVKQIRHIGYLLVETSQRVVSQRRGDHVPLLARVNDDGEHVVPRGLVVLVCGEYYREVPRPPVRSVKDLGHPSPEPRVRG